MSSSTLNGYEISVEIGGLPILLRTQDPSFLQILHRRYSGFVSKNASPRFEFEVDLVPPSREMASDEDVRVTTEMGRWQLRRGDFLAQWDPRAGRGRIRQTANPYSIDSVLRIVHSLILAGEGGFLLHAASAIRGGRAFLFSGISGAGKTTISRLAPPDVTLLSDEVSYLRCTPAGYEACGTPFAGELARSGENCSAPVAGLFFLEKGPQNHLSAIPPIEAVGALLRNILFFAEEEELVRLIFGSACAFVNRVPVQRLTFFPDRRVWSLIE